MSASPLPAPEEPPEGPGQLLRTNPVFTRLWLGHVLSGVGDWLNFVALLALVLELTGSGMSVSLVLLVTALTSLAVAPLAGVAADRWDRRRIMIAADLVRVPGALGFLLVRRPEDVWLVYALLAANAAAASFHSPAATAALPNLVARRHLNAANALVGASSGVLLALAAWLGGLVAAWLGRPTAFALDALSFLVSALLVVSVRLPFSTARPGGPHPEVPGPGGLDVLRRMAWELGEALAYALGKREVGALLVLKVAAGLGGGLLTLLSVFPVQVLRAGDFGVGLLYAARGLGTLGGAVVAGALAGPPRRRAFLACAGLVVSGLLSAVFGATHTLAQAALVTTAAYLGVGLLAVYGGALLQEFCEDRFRGRVFSLDNAAMTLAASASTLLCGWGLVTLGPRQVAVLAGGAVALAGAAWAAGYGGLAPLRFAPPTSGAPPGAPGTPPG